MSENGTKKAKKKRTVVKKRRSSSNLDVGAGDNDADVGEDVPVVTSKLAAAARDSVDLTNVKFETGDSQPTTAPTKTKSKKGRKVVVPPIQLPHRRSKRNSLDEGSAPSINVNGEAAAGSGTGTTTPGSGKKKVRVGGVSNSEREPMNKESAALKAFSPRRMPIKSALKSSAKIPTSPKSPRYANNIKSPRGALSPRSRQVEAEMALLSPRSQRKRRTVQKKERRRSVQFADVKVREYKVRQGGSCAVPYEGAFPLGLSWKYKDANTKSLDAYEEERLRAGRATAATIDPLSPRSRRERIMMAADDTSEEESASGGGSARNSRSHGGGISGAIQGLRERRARRRSLEVLGYVEQPQVLLSARRHAKDVASVRRARERSLRGCDCRGNCIKPWCPCARRGDECFWKLCGCNEQMCGNQLHLAAIMTEEALRLEAQGDVIPPEAVMVAQNTGAAVNATSTQ